ncbi:MAG: 2-succinyl-5-enolpyruvyl-6-hydroxy-3-cyclohexene-1-carboxylic-acid synthase [Flavobacteriaceae bacterium]|nr:2-succinyl-5-enolpyruvyl-6-hydroxy-3-cyclohexene-1-carboxylic-acid synthase [Flavobacteriaceae bacterium]MCI5088342.1 2-succinyl-5-enolpyruvyl-6-hydroxy-3-cyclohexene-1-carboxylic-acid synthase [Flavobacteriaceae bacterium]
MKYSNIPLAQLTVSACKFYGIRRIVISPGSRNAPLTLSFLADHYFECYSVVDERAAAFFGMGLSQQDQNPVALVCTSGSALLNYYPAISEAYYSQIPLVVISADRPSYLIDKGYGQTIRQEGVFEKHIAFSAHLMQDASHASQAYLNYMPKELIASQEQVEAHNTATLSEAFQSLLASGRPIHLNVPLEEPLYGTTNFTEASAVFERALSTPSYGLEDAYKKAWNTAEKIMVILGVCPDKGVNAISKETINFLAADSRVLVLTETTSNVHHPSFIDSIDNLMAPIESTDALQMVYEELKPDLLVSVGGAVVSKKIKGFLNCQRPALHIQLGNTLVKNPFFTDFHALPISANDFFSQMPASDTVTPIGATYKSKHILFKNIYKKQLLDYCTSAPFSDFTAFYAVLKSLPNPAQLQLANSATIRYAQLFSVAEGISVFCNRGTSGIDGSISTAIGAAVSSNTQTICLTGDLSFFYDSNALWNDCIPNNFRIIVVNNQGGGIFRVLPGKSDSENFSRYFETVHTLNASHLCAMHGLTYHKADNSQSLADALRSFYEPSSAPQLLEIFTPRTTNDEVLKEFFNSLSVLYKTAL